MTMLKHGARQSGRALFCAALLAVLAACGGGGTSQVVTFAPTRVIVFGDETSVITDKGRKYGVNAVNSTYTDEISCSGNPNWVQSLASTYGVVFSQCNPSNLATTKGMMYATYGAKVADVATKIDAHFAIDTFGAKDLVPVLVGANDILELYKQFPAVTRAVLLADAGTRGRNLATQINRIANAGGKVLAVTVPDQGLTPYALTEKSNYADINRAQLLSDLTTEFNTQMRLNILEDGSKIGLVLADEAIQAIAKYPSSYGYTNVTDVNCWTTIDILDCTTLTTTSNTSGGTYLWANTLLLGPSGQSRIASLAQTRASSNPF